MSNEMEGNEIKIEALDEEDILKLLWTGLIWNDPNLNYDELCDSVSVIDLLNFVGPILECLAEDSTSTLKKPV